MTQKIQTTQAGDHAPSDSSEIGDFIERSYEALFVPDTDTDTDMFIWSLIQVHRLFPNK